MIPLVGSPCAHPMSYVNDSFTSVALMSHLGIYYCDGG